ncbi:MAG TPA: NADH-quinone oxidoreductase subunit G [Pseudonocardiaceae bacterium]|jgi:NADH-quinone oxidoreductase subunit G|nr:NADH-quinone oxidoreductase subunit G [Pseudonocardiaceae bacterium]
MTIAPEQKTDRPVPAGHVRLTVDGVEIDAPKGELIIRAAERIGVEIPRFCDHPLLDPAAACRQCLVEVEMGGRPMPKPQPACAVTVADGMVVRTQRTSAVADKAQQGVMEMLLINHPLDCPICDKGGECPLQNQALKHGRADSRFVDSKRTFPKPINITPQVLLDRERCVLCQRCTRFADEIAGDRFIALLERGALQQIGTAETADLPANAQRGDDIPGGSYFSGNVIQICPVGALTSAAYRFRSRPFDLVSTPSVCEHCASGCAQRTDWRRGKVTRRLAGNDPDVNEEWNCDKGRFAFTYATAGDRIQRPMVRDPESGELRDSTWTEALRAAAAGLAAARDAKGVGVLTGGRLTVEDAYAYSKFARMALRTNDIDFRARVHSAEELDFLTDVVLGQTPERGGVTYADVEAAPTVLTVAFEPEEESPIVFLRLRKSARRGKLALFHVGQWTTPSVRKTGGTLVPSLPGAEPRVVADLPTEVTEALRKPGSVILVGERAAGIPGLFTAVRAAAELTGARIAWIPRRAGERGALAAGAAPSLLPGGRLVTDAVGRAEVEKAWGLTAGALPSLPGRDAAGIVAAAASSGLSGLVVAGVDPDDLPDPALAVMALSTVDFVVSLELRVSEVTRRAHVVLPIAPAVEKSGTYLNWEGRPRPFDQTLENPGSLPDCRVLDTLAVEMDVDLFTQTSVASAGDLNRLGDAADRLGTAAPARTPVAAGRTPAAGPGQALLATWRELLDNGSLQDGEPHLAATAKVPVVRLGAATAAALGVTFGEPATVHTGRDAVTLPAVEADLPDGVVWLPENSGPAELHRLGAAHGDLVNVRAAGTEREA